MPKIDLNTGLASSLPDDFVAFELDLEHADNALVAAAIEINARRAEVEDPEGLRHARAL